MSQTFRELTLVPAALTGRINRGLFVPVEVRPDIGPAIAARLTGKPGFKIRQANVIRPPVSADRRGMAATIIRAIDREPAYAHSPHLAEADLLLPLHHVPSLARIIAGDFGFFTLIQSVDRPAL